MLTFIRARWGRLSYPDRYTAGDWLFFAAFGASQVTILIGGSLILYRLFY